MRRGEHTFRLQRNNLPAAILWQASIPDVPAQTDRPIRPFPFAPKTVLLPDRAPPAIRLPRHAKSADCLFAASALLQQSKAKASGFDQGKPDSFTIEIVCAIGRMRP